MWLSKRRDMLNGAFSFFLLYHPLISIFKTPSFSTFVLHVVLPSSSATSPPSVVRSPPHLSFYTSSFSFSSFTPSLSSYFSTSSPCAAALHQPVSESAVRRVKAGIHYVADVLRNADIHCMYPVTPSTTVHPVLFSR